MGRRPTHWEMRGCAVESRFRIEPIIQESISPLESRAIGKSDRQRRFNCLFYGNLTAAVKGTFNSHSIYARKGKSSRTFGPSCQIFAGEAFLGAVASASATLSEKWCHADFTTLPSTTYHKWGWEEPRLGSMSERFVARIESARNFRSSFRAFFSRSDTDPTHFVFDT